MPKIKFTQFYPEETAKKIDVRKVVNEDHIRITKSMFNNQSFRNLSANAIILYIFMKFRFYKQLQNGEDFEFSQSLGINVLRISKNSGNTVKRALKQLVRHGLIEYTYISRGGGKYKKVPNRFMFSTNWKNRIY